MGNTINGRRLSAVLGGAVAVAVVGAIAVFGITGASFTTSVRAEAEASAAKVQLEARAPGGTWAEYEVGDTALQFALDNEFQNVAASETRTADVEIRNSGTRATVLTHAGTAGTGSMFAIDPEQGASGATTSLDALPVGTVLQPGEERTVTVTLTATAALVEESTGTVMLNIDAENQ